MNKNNTFSNKYNILLIEDDRRLSDGIVLALRNESYLIRQCFSLKELQSIDDKNADLVILDINLPDGSGLDYLKKLRKESNTQVIILTANDLETDVIEGFELGADDYITKPFSLAVLRARVNARLRVADEIKEKHNNTDENKLYKNDRFVFDFNRMVFLVNDNQVELSRSEQKLLYLLVSNKGITLKRDMLLDKVWTENYDFVDENALSVTVKRLRDKLEKDASKPEFIKTVYGIGYRFEDK